MTYILGISAYYHDSAAALIKDGVVIYAAQEERFSRVKHDKSFPVHAINFILNDSGISLDQIEAIIFYEKPYLKFKRLLKTYIDFFPYSIIFFINSFIEYVKKKLFLDRNINLNLKKIYPNYKKKKNQIYRTSLKPCGKRILLQYIYRIVNINIGWCW